ncbi:antibiotic biosynthesis monooxygenase [Nonomuraea sp. MCN248]|uniref:Antibiotic biosynthesis monooxygenase n=1 Tax=Nonomuraea corallina TaxID=2989783 RepID=A0ABT4S6D0_9ACTN|nr:antibiotic biosynthesis monooxygenase family protein [Nonomuraea corallina]MDA0632768.1 antibiotic biosynthesis monooxygenase [Nonomuraea corallina]
MPHVTFVNTFLLHAPAEEFERAFAATSEFMAARPGFLWHQLLRPLEPAPLEPAPLEPGPLEPGQHGSRYVNVAAWRDEESFRAAVTHPGFAPHAAALRALAASEPVLYETRQTRTTVTEPA